MNHAEVTAAALEKGADLIENVGWTRGAGMKYADGGVIAYCASGATYTALMTDIKDDGFFHLHFGEIFHDALEALGKTAAELYPGGPGGDRSLGLSPCIPFVVNTPDFNAIVRWNDHYARSAAEVVDVMRHTAKKIRTETGA